MMTNIDLEEDCKEFQVPLVGIFNKDLLPPTPQAGGYIINTQDDLCATTGEDLPGTHWVAFYIEGKHAVYFDSFGFAPALQVQNFLKPFIPYEYNTQLIQNIRSGVCGKYVLFFLVYMTRMRRTHPDLNTRFKQFLRLWSPNVLDNRTILLEQLKKIKK